MIPPSLRSFVAVSVLACLSASPAGAEPADRQAPLEAGSDEVASTATTSMTTSQPTATTKRPWRGEAEAGYIRTAGNSRTETARTRMKIVYSHDRWSHGATADYLRTAERGVSTAEQFTGTLRSDRSLTERSYLYVNVRYESDRFAGYRPRLSETTGYGRRIPLGDRGRFEAEAGAGGRQVWATDGSRERGAIMRLAARVLLPFGAASEFSEEAFSEMDGDNVHSESSTSLKTRINADFSLKTNVTAKHDSAVPDGRQKTDTITSITLVYDL
jgi:putative salt-induced outer membrane protein